MSNDPRRLQRMASLLLGEIQRLLIEEVSDPGLRAIHVTEVKLSRDLKQATVRFSQREAVSVPEKEVLRGFRRAGPFLRKRIAENLELRYVPALEFEKDTQGESINRLLHLMEEVRSGQSGETARALRNQITLVGPEIGQAPQ